MGPNYRQAEKTSLSFGLVLTLAEREGFELKTRDLPLGILTSGAQTMQALDRSMS
jgi:hypothetical protein